MTRIIFVLLVLATACLSIQKPVRTRAKKSHRLQSTSRTSRNFFLAMCGFLISPGVKGILICVAIFVTSEKVIPLLEKRDSNRIALMTHSDVITWIEKLLLGLASGATVHNTMLEMKRHCPCSLAQCIEEYEGLVRSGLTSSQALSAAFAQQPNAQTTVRILIRSHETGSSARQALALVAEDIRVSHVAQATAKMRAVSVKAVLPLGLCFLPAFIFVTVIPLAASLISTLN